jgi:vacuolar-type H+-ATPase subunit E/Vma4
MKARLPAGASAALDPVRAALLSQARSDAGRVLAEARQRAEHERAASRGRAEQMLRAGRDEGERRARAAAASQLTRRRRDARDTLLAAQCTLYDELRRRCHDAARELREAPDYPDLLRLLTDNAGAALGRDASIHESADGGVVAVAGSRRLDLSLPTLVDEELDRLGEEARQLWTT